MWDGAVVNIVLIITIIRYFMCKISQYSASQLLISTDMDKLLAF